MRPFLKKIKDGAGKVFKGIGKLMKSKEVQNVLRAAGKKLVENAPKLIEKGVQLLPMVV